jgi:formamidopyrimidine-DNA glycosylase
MPELPDITAYLTALASKMVGERLEGVRIASPLLLRTALPPIQSAEGKVVKELRRLGKRIVFVLEPDAAGEPLSLVLHLMIAGRLHWRERGARLAGRNALAAFDFERGSLVLTEAGAQRRAALHVVRGEAALAELDPGGAEVFALSEQQFREVLSAENHTLKRALTDPRVLSGIGNAYSDEILWAAKLSPLAQTQKLTADEWKRLYRATTETLRLWMDRLNAEAAKKFPEKVTAFRPEMAVHGRYGLPCPRCGAPVQRIRYASNETNYCPTCQTGGRVLADRSLSRLLGADWPRTLEELEALKRK